MTLIDWQFNLLWSTAPIRLGFGGRRSGKTIVGLEVFKVSKGAHLLPLYVVPNARHFPRDLAMPQRDQHVVTMDTFLRAGAGRPDILIVDETPMTLRAQAQFAEMVSELIAIGTKVVLLGTPAADIDVQDTLEYELWSSDRADVAKFGIPTADAPWIGSGMVERARYDLPYVVWRAEYLAEFITDTVLMPWRCLEHGGSVAEAGYPFYHKLGFEEMERSAKEGDDLLMKLPAGWSHKRVPSSVPDMYYREIYDANKNNAMTLWFKTSHRDTRSMCYPRGMYDHQTRR